jgi:hypothetical protein
MRARGPASCSMRLRARLLAASSYLCLALFLTGPAEVRAETHTKRPAVIARAPMEAPFHDHYFFSLEGGNWFNNSGTNLTFDPTDTFLKDLPSLKPGGDGDTFAATFGRTMGPQWDWMAGYRYSSLGTGSSNVTTILPSGGPILFNSLTASASNGFRFQQFDGELGYHPPQWQGVRVFLGPRIVNAHNHIGYAYDQRTGSIVGDFSKLGNFDHDIDLWGVGPRAGLQASVPLFAMPSPISLEMSGSASAIFSQVTHHSDFSFANHNGAGTETGSGISSIGSSPTVYNIEGSVGLGYRISDSIVVQGGYQAARWYNLATTVNLANSAGSFQQGKSDILVQGAFGKMTFALPY